MGSLHTGKRVALIALAITVVLSLSYFPWNTDSPLTSAEQLELQKYYATAYKAQGDVTNEENENSGYVRIGKTAAEQNNIRGRIAAFAETYGLTDKKVLDIGAGRGYLQDVVKDYTGLDISPTAKRFFHKPFILGSATLMPFQPDAFDAAWSIWVLEHVPNPEASLVEMRRVVKDGGVLFLLPAWNCTPYAADGYPVRPYADFGLAGKLTKASIPAWDYLWSASTVPVRLIRDFSRKVIGGPTQFRYRRLIPNYHQYWMPDSDAVNSLDRRETAMWFTSRGDQCLNCGDTQDGSLIIRIHKVSTAAD